MGLDPTYEAAGDLYHNPAEWILPMRQLVTWTSILWVWILPKRQLVTWTSTLWVWILPKRQLVSWTFTL